MAVIFLAELRRIHVPGTVIAAESESSAFDAVTDNFAAAVSANWRKALDRTFKIVEDVGLAFNGY